MLCGQRVECLSRSISCFQAYEPISIVIQKVVGYFEVDVGSGTLAKADVSIKPENLTTKEPAKKDGGRGGNARASESGAVPTGYEYLELGTLIPDWKQWLVRHDNDHTVGLLRSSLGFVLANIVETIPEFTPADLTIAKNGDGPYDLYTHRAFKAGELALAPETLDWKTRLWTNTRSVLTKHPATLHPEHKFFVMYGKLRSVPSDVRPFSLFFIVRATSMKSIANTVMEYPAVSATVTIAGLSKRRKVEVPWNQEDWPSVPVMLNQEDIPASTLLQYFDDKSLSKYADKLAKETGAAKKGDKKK